MDLNVGKVERLFDPNHGHINRDGGVRVGLSVDPLAIWGTGQHDDMREGSVSHNEEEGKTYPQEDAQVNTKDSRDEECGPE